MQKTILEQTPDEFKKFVIILKSFNSANTIAINEGKMLISIIGGLVIQEFPEYPDLKMRFTRVKETITIISALVKLKIDRVHWEEHNTHYLLKVYHNDSFSPIKINLPKSDSSSDNLEIPDLSLYQQTYNKGIDKNTISTILTATKEFQNNGQTDVILKLSDNGQLGMFKVQDKISSAEIDIPVEDIQANKTLKINELYNGKATGNIVINIQQDKRNRDNYLVITYLENDPTRKTLQFSEIEDESTPQFF